ncbi:hypothetical protein AZI11_14630 (plasmid) [Levilactobacillus brevis]|nr:hypothetical protein AZI11_14630 [Levilactobacillus brevis]ARN96658.1 hypothetical protein AZI12_14410 [Levilactobacillus brevis]
MFRSRVYLGLGILFMVLGAIFAFCYKNVFIRFSVSSSQLMISGSFSLLFLVVGLILVIMSFRKR